MNDTKIIVNEIRRLERSLTGRLDEMEERLGLNEKATKTVVRAVRENRSEINRLKEKMEELSKTNAVWRSQDGTRTGIDKDAAYEAFHELKIPRRDALKALEMMGILIRSGDNLTKAVRVGDRVIRAVVITEV